MLKTAEAVSLGHPDKISDYISSYILDRMIEMDTSVKYAVEVMVKDNTVILGGEIAGNVDLTNITEYVKSALREIGYDGRYATIWGEYAININKVNVINLIGVQSPDINRGVQSGAWGDQGMFVGYACNGPDNINTELYLARKLNRALYDLARNSDNLGLDIKTQITIDERGKINTAIVAIPMLKKQDLEQFIIDTLGQTPAEIIVNGTGIYTYHSSVADCGVTGRKLACDFYSTASPIGGGSPWTKDATKADLTLNMYARYLALENLGRNDDECWVYLSSCIGRKLLPSGLIKTIRDGVITERNLFCIHPPRELIKLFGLDRPIYTHLCRNGLQSLNVVKS
ncbi:MAG: methionine adenosyltransferase domain-containing protein [Alphaproteobacteria bacterium]|nr:methionine adenosyltransferase domain-containing protein [Alphaproteobacteria bacterium]